MKVAAGAVVVGMIWWGVASVVGDAPPPLESPVVGLEAEPVAGSGALPVGAFCPLPRHFRPCQLHSAEPSQLSLRDTWRRGLESPGLQLAESDRQMLNAMGYRRLAAAD